MLQQTAWRWLWREFRPQHQSLDHWIWRQEISAHVKEERVISYTFLKFRVVSHVPACSQHLCVQGRRQKRGWGIGSVATNIWLNVNLLPKWEALAPGCLFSRNPQKWMIACIYVSRKVIRWATAGFSYYIFTVTLFICSLF